MWYFVYRTNKIFVWEMHKTTKCIVIRPGGWDDSGRVHPGEDRASAQHTYDRDHKDQSMLLPWSMLNSGKGLGNNQSIRDEALSS